MDVLLVSRPPRPNPVWDGQRYIVAEARSDWPSARILVRDEDISRPRSWKDVTANHTIIVNLGGLTRHFERELDNGTHFAHPTTVGDMSILPAGCGFAGMYDGHTVKYAIWEMPVNELVHLADEARTHLPTEIKPRLAHRDELIYRAVERLAELAEGGDNLSALLGETINRTIGLHLISAYGSESSPPLAQQILPSNVVRELQDFVEAHLSDKITLDDLAAIAGESTHHLLIGFRQRFSTTPFQYIIQQRLRRSRWLLHHTRKPISEIAYAVGFSSQSHLTDAFRRNYGTTPNSFRKSLQ